VLIATGVSSTIAAALLTGVCTLQRSFQASEYYAAALNDQTRALDYIVRDSRGALSVQVSADANTLTITLPDYYSSYDAQGNPNGMPVTPLLGTNTAIYNDPGKPVMISYFAEGRSLMRQVTIGRTGSTSKAVIASDVDNFTFTFGAIDSTVTASLTFSPRFQGISPVTDQRTKRTAVIYMRNHKSA
ncbi:MAG: hypothetical protein JWL90_612, partial [Chthoniobacteraceae bacterium]|nr:hypothetical protein [Chthoniobacteraceae bacterium]